MLPNVPVAAKAGKNEPLTDIACVAIPVSTVLNVRSRSESDSTTWTSAAMSSANINRQVSSRSWQG